MPSKLFSIITMSFKSMFVIVIAQLNSMSEEHIQRCDICQIPGPNLFALKHNLTSLITKLKNIQKQKLAQISKSQKRRGISEDKIEYLDLAARWIRVYEALECHCQYLLDEIGSFNHVSWGIDEFNIAVSSIIWTSRNLINDQISLKIVEKQIILKYGKQYAKLAENNEFGTVSENLITALNLKPSIEVSVEQLRTPGGILSEGSSSIRIIKSLFFGRLSVLRNTDAT